jgi:hypothetical protein
LNCSSKIVGQELNRRAQAHFVEIAGNRPDVGRNRHFIVVQHHQQIGVRQMTSVVNRFQGHTAGEGTIANDSGHFIVFASMVTGQGHPQSSGDAGRGVPGSKVVKRAFAALKVASHPIFLTQGVELGVTTGDQLVGVSLVPYIPTDLVMV